MRIGIDARMYGPEQGGLGRYIQQLITHLEELVTEDEVFIFMRKSAWNSYTPTNPRFHKILADIPWYGWEEQIRFPYLLKQYHLDRMHFPHWNVPLLYRRPFIVTIHDLLLLHYPTRQASTLGPITYWIKNKVFLHVLRHAAASALHILTPSQFSKDDIVKTLHVASEKITVTYPAPTGFVSSPSTSTHNILTKYNITRPYFLYVGVAFPHKNLPGLLDSWTRYKKQHSSHEQLVLVGKPNFFYNNLIQSSQFKQSPDVTYAGFVPDTELPAFYAGAKAFIMPSLYEGFGIPPLEALSYGTPVVAAHTSCLPEVLGSAAHYFDPHNADSLSQTLHTFSTTPIATTTVKAVLKRYNWKKLAAETLACYHHGG